MQRQSVVTRNKKQPIKSVRAEALSAATDDFLESDPSNDQDRDDYWLSTSLKEKDRSRIQRQMKARRELERRQEEKRLKELVEDWYLDDK